MSKHSENAQCCSNEAPSQHLILYSYRITLRCLYAARCMISYIVLASHMMRNTAASDSAVIFYMRPRALVIKQWNNINIISC